MSIKKICIDIAMFMLLFSAGIGSCEPLCAVDEIPCSNTYNSSGGTCVKNITTTNGSDSETTTYTPDCHGGFPAYCCASNGESYGVTGCTCTCEGDTGVAQWTGCGGFP